MANELTEQEKKELLKRFGTGGGRREQFKRGLRRIGGGVKGKIQKEIAIRKEERRIFGQAFREEKTRAIRTKARRAARRSVLGPSAFTVSRPRRRARLRRVRRGRFRRGVGPRIPRRFAEPTAVSQKEEFSILPQGVGGFTLFPEPRRKRNKR